MPTLVDLVIELLNQLFMLRMIQMESGGDIEEAAVFLYKKQLAKANKKDSCVAAKGKMHFSS